jgi:hypothetical protein
MRVRLDLSAAQCRRTVWTWTHSVPAMQTVHQWQIRRYALISVQLCISVDVDKQCGRRHTVWTWTHSVYVDTQCGRGHCVHTVRTVPAPAATCTQCRRRAMPTSTRCACNADSSSVWARTRRSRNDAGLFQGMGMMPRNGAKE